MWAFCGGRGEVEKEKEEKEVEKEGEIVKHEPNSLD